MIWKFLFAVSLLALACLTAVTGYVMLQHGASIGWLMYGAAVVTLLFSVVVFTT